MVRVKLSKQQVVQFPKSVSFPDTVKQVDIVIHGRARIITPESWDSWFDGEGVSEDFMASREQPEHQEREVI